MGVGEEKEAMRAEELLTENKSATDYSVMISRSTVLLLTPPLTALFLS